MRAAAVYVRVSSEEQAREGISLDMQADVCTKAALAAGATSVEVFRDEGFTGTNLNRPALKALLSRLGEFSALYVWKVDRLSRKVKDRIGLLDTFVEAGLRFVSATEEINLDTATGRFFVNVMASFSQMEVELLRERVRAALEHRALVQGKHVGKPPYGYRLVTPGEPWAILPEEAAVVQRLHRDFAAGASVIGLARTLNAEGVPTRHLKRWSYTTVRKILGNLTYLGRNAFRGEFRPGLHPPIVAEEIMAGVTERLKARAALPRHYRRDGRSLAPILRCGACGGHVRQSGTLRGYTGTEGRALTYLCIDERRQATARHDPLCVPAVKAEEAVWRFLARYLEGRLQRHYTQAQQRRALVRESASYRENETRLAEVEGKLEKNQEALQAGAITTDLLAKWNRPLLVERQRLQDALDAATRLPDLGALGNVPDADALVTAIRRQPRESQLALLTQVFQRIELHRNLLVFVTTPEIGHVYRVALPRRWEPQKGIGEEKFLLYASSSLTTSDQHTLEK